jgi:hypothetical protein
MEFLVPPPPPFIGHVLSSPLSPLAVSSSLSPFLCRTLLGARVDHKARKENKDVMGGREGRRVAVCVKIEIKAKKWHREDERGCAAFRRGKGVGRPKPTVRPVCCSPPPLFLQLLKLARG